MTNKEEAWALLDNLIKDNFDMWINSDNLFEHHLAGTLCEVRRLVEEIPPKTQEN